MENLIVNVKSKMKDLISNEDLEILEKVLIEELNIFNENKDKSNEKLLEDFISSKYYENCSKQTIEQYKRENSKFLKSINKRVQDVKKKDIENYLYEYKILNDVSNVTLNNMRRFISAFFNYLEYEDIITCNPVRKTKPIKEIKKVKETFSDLEIEKMRDNAETLRDKAIIETLNSTGVRISELCSMNINDIHGKSAIIRGKGAKERRVYFSDKSIYYLNNYLQTRNDNCQALFVNKRRTGAEYNRISKNSAEKMIRDIGANVNIKAHPHKFRRTVATRAINKGMPLQEVRILLGHTKLDTTLIYCNVAEDNIKSSHTKYVA